MCAVVVALGLGASAQNGPERQEPAQKGQAASDQRAQIAPVSPPVSESQRKGGENQREARAQPSDIADRDLKAQQAMAFIAAIQLFLTGVGIWYIRKTLVATEKAVGEAGAATETAKSAVAVTREGQKLALRAWVSITDITMTVVPEGITARVAFKNTGQTPANNLGARLWVQVWQGRGVAEGNLIEHPVDEANASRNTLGRDATKGISHIAAILPGHTPQEIWDGEFVIVAHGFVVYDDVFGERHETRFCSFRDAHTKTLETPIAAAHFGNGAT